MAHEVIAVKLYELDKEFSKLHSRLELSENGNSAQIEEEIRQLKKECAENQVTLYNRLKSSRSQKVKQIAEAYETIEGVIKGTHQEIFGKTSDSLREQMSEEDLILLAEYSLDFAMQAANNALLISMEAIQTQKEKSNE